MKLVTRVFAAVAAAGLALVASVAQAGVALKAAFVAAVTGSMLLGSNVAHAALATGITDAIDDAQADMLSLLTALTLAGVAIWVGMVIYRKFKV